VGSLDVREEHLRIAASATHGFAASPEGVLGDPAKAERGIRGSDGGRAWRLRPPLRSGFPRCGHGRETGLYHLKCLPVTRGPDIDVVVKSPTTG
jgi:hypothetical protein